MGKIKVQIIAGSLHSNIKGKSTLIANSSANNSMHPIIRKFAKNMLPTSAGARTYLMKIFKGNDIFSGNLDESVTPLINAIANAARRWTIKYRANAAYIDPNLKASTFGIFNGVSEYVLTTAFADKMGTNVLGGLDATKLQAVLKDLVLNLGNYPQIAKALSAICSSPTSDDSGFSELWYALNHDTVFKEALMLSGFQTEDKDADDFSLFDAEKMVDAYTMRKSKQYIFDTFVGIIYSAISDAFMINGLNNKKEKSVAALLGSASQVVIGQWPGDKAPSTDNGTIFLSMTKAMQSALGKDDDLMAIKTLNDLLSKAYASRMLLKRYYMDADNFTATAYENAPKLLAAFRRTAKRISTAPDTPAALSALTDFENSNEFKGSLAGALYAQTANDYSVDPMAMDYVIEIVNDSALTAAYNSSAISKFVKLEELNEDMTLHSSFFRGQRYKMTDIKQQSVTFNKTGLLTHIGGIEVDSIMTLIGIGLLGSNNSGSSEVKKTAIQYYRLLTQYAMMNADINTAILRGSLTGLAGDYQFSANVKMDVSNRFKQLESSVMIDLAIYRMSSKFWAMETFATLNDLLCIVSRSMDAVEHEFITKSELEIVRDRISELSDMINSFSAKHFPLLELNSIKGHVGVLPVVNLTIGDVETIEPSVVMRRLIEIIKRKDMYFAFRDAINHTDRILGAAAFRNKTLSLAEGVFDLKEEYFSIVNQTLFAVEEKGTPISVDKTYEILNRFVTVDDFKGKFMRDADSMSFSFFEQISNILSSERNPFADWKPKGLRTGNITGSAVDLTKMPSVILSVLKQKMINKVQVSMIDDTNADRRLAQLHLKFGTVMSSLLKLGTSILEGAPYDLWMDGYSIYAVSEESLKENIFNLLGITGEREINEAEFNAVRIMIGSVAPGLTDYPFSINQATKFSEGMKLKDAIKINKSYYSPTIKNEMGHYTVLIRPAEMMRLLMSDVILSSGKGDANFYLMSTNSVYFGAIDLEDIYLHIGGGMDKPIWEPVTDWDVRDIVNDIAIGVHALLSSENPTIDPKDDKKDPEVEE